MPADERLLDGVVLATIVLRVRDLETSVAWYRKHVGLVPIHRGADGNTPPYAAYDVAGTVVTLWQLFDGQDRSAEDSDLDSYLVLVVEGDLTTLHERLTSAGVTVDVMRSTRNNQFFWFHDPDGNRWEISRPITEGRPVRDIPH